MRKTLPAWVALLALAWLGGGLAPARAAEPEETLLLQDPAVSAHQVAFVYAQDLWIVDRAGGTARRLTSGVGRESNPRFSPDGTQLAFTGEYQGNPDVYVMPVEGGTPRRLTWHPGRDYVRAWNPDGKHVLFASDRTGGEPVMKLFLASLDGGMPQPLDVPRAAHATYDPTGTRLAYTPVFDAFRTWKRYRGGRLPPVWIYDPKTHDVEQVPHVRASDTFPCWVGDRVYFASDRKGKEGVAQMNLWSYKPGSHEAPRQISHFVDYGIRNMSAGADALVFTLAGSIRLYEPATDTFRKLTIHVPTDGLARRPHWTRAKGQVRGASIAPNGKRAVFEARGEMITLPREHGAARNLTNSPGSNERSPAWSPDGKSIAWFSDASGEYELVVQDRLGREEPRHFPLGGARFYNDPVWSPDGKRILFNDKGNRLAYLTLATGKVTDVHTSQGTLGQFRPAGCWSRDSKWIAFETLDPETAYGGVALYELATGKVTTVTDGFGDAASPAFSRDGKYLFFQASVDEGPQRFGLDLSTSAVRPGTSHLYVVVLRKDGHDPLGPRSDEAVSSKPAEAGPDHVGGDDGPGGKHGKEKGANDGKGKTKAEPKEGKQAAKPAGPSIDVEGISQRILALPVPDGTYRGLACSKSKLLFLDAPRHGKGGLQAFDFTRRKATTIVPGADALDVSADGRWLLVHLGDRWQIANEAGKDRKSLGIDAVKILVDPAREWPQILREAWRIERDFFYDPHMHGVDWPAMWDRWSRFLPYVQHRQDLNVLIMEMIGELCCGHEYVWGGDMPKADGGIDVGLLGADYALEHGRYRITRIYEGQNWNPSLRAPLTVPGVDVHAGDYLLAVNGHELRANDNVFEAFQGTAGEPTELRVAATPDGSDSRTVTVTPIGNDGHLRRLAWIESNRRRVDELSHGRLAYVYMPNTAGAGLAAFDRDFFSQLGKQGLVLDERYNSGGKVADYIMSVLGRHVICYWMNREGWLGRTPFGTLVGPKVMIVNGYAGSGGDAMPWMFQQLHLGPVVGTRTWGGLVGISGYPPLVDGGHVTAASFGIMDPHGHWAVENQGVTPDHEVIPWPKDVIGGHDPQLEKAVQVALDLLAKTPPPKRPGYVPPAPR